jgi:hypothetical protein
MLKKKKKKKKKEEEAVFLILRTKKVEDLRLRENLLGGKLFLLYQ